VATADTAGCAISVMSRPVHRDQRLARLGRKRRMIAVVARDALVVRIERDQLGAERAL